MSDPRPDDDFDAPYLAGLPEYPAVPARDDTQPVGPVARPSALPALVVVTALVCGFAYVCRLILEAR